jgi:hypothetical protein
MGKVSSSYLKYNIFAHLEVGSGAPEKPLDSSIILGQTLILYGNKDGTPAAGLDFKEYAHEPWEVFCGCHQLIFGLLC